MQMIKRIFALVLTLAVLVSTIPVQAFATEPQVAPEVDPGDMTIEGTNGFGNLLSEAITMEEESTEAESSEYEAGYTVTDLEIEGNVATVSYESQEEAILVVALYTEDGMQMLASGKTTVGPDTEKTTVTIEGTMPEYFMASAYLVDTYDLSPLCAAYDTPMYTQEMQELLASTVNDYDPELVLNLDESEETNFAVYAETTKVIEYVEGKNVVASVNDETSTYVIENADERLTGLQVGDVLAYSYGENEILIAKIANITVDGTTVTIVGDDLELADVFDCVKIDGQGDESCLTIDESTASEGVVYVRNPEGILPTAIAPTKTDSESVSMSIGISFEGVKLGGSALNVKLTGSGTLALSIGIEFYVTKAYQQFAIRAEVSLTGTVGVTGTASGKIKLGDWNFDLIPSVLQLGTAINLVVEVEGKLEASVSLKLKMGVVVEHGKQGWEFEKYCKPELKVETKFEGSLFYGFELEPNSKLLYGVLADIKVTASGGREYSLEKVNDFESHDDEIHLCDNCFSGEIKEKVSLNGSAKFLKSKKLSVKIKIAEFSKKIDDIFWSDGMIAFKSGHCPNLSYKLTVIVVDTSKQPVKDAAVSVGEFNGTTDKNGIVTVFLPVEEYEITVQHGDLSRKYTLYLDSAKEAKITLARNGESTNLFDSIIPDEVVDKTIYIASGYCGDNVSWTLSDDGILSIAGKGSMWYYDIGDAPWYRYRYNIASVIIGNGVTSIVSNAFSDCPGLTTVKIPGSVETIGYGAFRDCVSLKSVKIPNAVTEISGNTFEYCTSLTSIEFSKSLTSIGYSAFSGCTSLKSVNIPNSVTYIDKYAFEDCTSLTSVELSESLTSIGYYAFSGCTSLMSVTIPDSVTYIGELAFKSCTSLTSVELSESLTTIEQATFRGCTALKRVTIPDGVTTIDTNAFADCTSLTTVMIPDSVTTIGAGAFSNCDSLISAKFPDSVTTIGSYAFSNCDSLTSIEIPAGVTTISSYAFEYCTGLTTVMIPDSVTTIGAGAFEKCTSLTSIEIPDSVTTIGSHAFNRTGLTDIEIPDSVTTIYSGAFSACDSLMSVMIPNSVTTISHSLFSDCDRLMSVTIPESVTTIGGYAFAHCSSLTRIEIPASVTTIGENAFIECHDLNEIVFCGNAPSIESKIFGYITATAYYPADNATWTSDVMKSFGGYITWVPYTLNTNGDMVVNKAAAVTVETELSDLDVPAVSDQKSVPQTGLELPAPDFGNPEDTLNPDAVFGGEYSTVVTETYTMKIASFSGLVPGEQYVLLAMVSIDTEDPLAADNLLYIDQAAALEDGTLVFQYVQRVTTDTSYVVACGVSGKNLKDAEITFPEMVADGEVHIINPTVVYDGETLIEGQDYTIQGTVSYTKPGTYTCTIKGVRNYSGAVECSYMVINPYHEIGYGFCGDNIVWTFYDNGRLTISGNGSMTAFENYPAVPWNSIRSEILTVIVEEGVTSIGNFAFAECTNLTSVSIGDSVTTIGDGAFEACTSLTGVKIPDSVTSIDSYVFRNCSSLTSVTIGDGLTEISTGAFQYCKKLSSVTVGGSVAVIKYSAFQYCSSLTNVTIPESVTTINSGAFRNCASLAGIHVDENNPNYSSDSMGVLFDKEKTELIQAPGAISGSYEIPGSVTTVEEMAFSGCTSLTGVEIPDSVISIGDSVFRGCSSLTSVTIGDGLTAISMGAFIYCRKLSSVAFGNSVAVIESDAFQSCTSLTNVTLPESVTEIGDAAFGGCTGLTNVTLPESVTEIGDTAFGGCTGLTGVTIPKNVTTIGDGAFGNCTSLTDIVFRGDAPTIAAEAFRGVTANGYYPEKNSTWTANVMQDYGGDITWISDSVITEVASGWSGDTEWKLYGDGRLVFTGSGKMKNYTYKSEMPWYPYMDQIASVVIREGVTSVGDYAFYGFGITSIEIPESVTYIGDFAFKNAAALDHVVLPSGLTKLGESAFYACTGLSSIDIPETLWTIQPYTFKNCTALTSVTFHEGNLQKISDGAFYNTALTRVELPNCLDILDSYVFKNCSQLADVKLSASLTQIREASLYGTAISSIEIPEGVTSIKPYAFKNCVNLKTVDMPSTLTSVDEAAFYACAKLTELQLPDAVTTIGNYAFRKCTGLTSVRFGSGLTTIGESSFYGCEKITSLTIPRGVTTIKGYAFKGCTALKSVSLPSTLTMLGESAFHSCVSLRSIVIPRKVTTIGEYCFSGSTGISTIEFLGSAPAIGVGAFNKITATAWYPDGDATWTADVMQNYGGSITWQAG